MIFPILGIFFLLHFFTPLLAQNHWDHVLPEKTENKTYLVFAENVNVRKQADIKSEIITKLQPGDKVKILKKLSLSFSQNKMKEYWYQIQSNDKSGFVWGSLLADSYAEIGDFKILIRNPGAATKKLEFKTLKEGKVYSILNTNPGPVANEEWKFNIYKSDSFSPNPGHLLGFRYLVYSEIEYAQAEETVFRIDEKGKTTEFFTWYPGACDPPSCMETWLVFPGDILVNDPSIARKEYKGQPNSILEITRSYDLDDVSINEFSVSLKKWNGKKLMDVK